jgi:monofunctional biosynthetic peptidoglycan transglycosylase
MNPLVPPAPGGPSLAWQVVNDGVMGGVSRGDTTLTPEGTLLFTGELSLAFQGGFASFRSRPTALGLQPGDALRLVVRGDGRIYSVNLYPERGPMAFSFRAALPTQADAESEVVLPLSDFRATQFGREVPGVTLEPGGITALGVMLADKRPGPFALEVRRIEIVRSGSSAD